MGKSQETRAPASLTELLGTISVLFDGKNPGGSGVQLGSMGKADSVWGFLLSRNGCIWVTSLRALGQHGSWNCVRSSALCEKETVIAPPHSLRPREDTPGRVVTRASRARGQMGGPSQSQEQESQVRAPQTTNQLRDPGGLPSAASSLIRHPITHLPGRVFSPLTFYEPPRLKIKGTTHL